MKDDRDVDDEVHPDDNASSPKSPGGTEVVTAVRGF